MYISPIRTLKPYIEQSPYICAPNRIADLAEVVRHHGLIAEYTMNGRFVCEIENGRITFDEFVAELFWCTSYAFHALYDYLERHPLAPPEHGDYVEIDLQAIGLADAFELLRWALMRLRAGTAAEWPAGLPRPHGLGSQSPVESAATVSCLRACAFVLHHEVAHAVLRHHSEGPEIERDADYAAADWLCSGASGDAKFTLSIVLGISVALLVFTIVEDLRGSASTTHPRAAERLVNTLDRCGIDEHHRIWLFVFTMLKIHLDNRLPEPPAVSLEGTRRDWVERLIEIYVQRLRS